MLSITTDPERGYIEFLVDGAIDHADLEAATRAIDTLLARHAQLGALKIVRTIGPVEPGLIWDNLAYQLRRKNFLRRGAVVTDHGWIKPLVGLLAPFYPAELRVFPEAELEAARAWAKA